MAKRVFLIVLDSLGIGEAPDAGLYKDKGSNTLAAIAHSSEFRTPSLQSLGLFNIKGVSYCNSVMKPLAAYARLEEMSRGKDTTIGHWEIAGINSDRALPLFLNGFPDDFIKSFQKAIGRRVLCNKSYSGTEVLRDYGEEHMRTGMPIVYTSADSVFQIAAHEEIIPVETLYKYCEIARKLLDGPLAVGRVIARPFVGSVSMGFRRTPQRKDFSLKPFARTMLDELLSAGYSTIGVGKIEDIFAGVGISEAIHTQDNEDGINVTMQLLARDFEGLAFINLVDFDMKYGHRNDVDGYAKALTQFDLRLRGIIKALRQDDILIITADHGCDPSTPSTDHSREYVPFLCYGAKIIGGTDLQTVKGFGCIAATICDYFGLSCRLDGQSLLGRILNS